MTTSRKRFALIGASILVLSACTNRPSTPAFTPFDPRFDGLGIDTIQRRDDVKIKHVVIIVQENRTVDNLFYGFPGADTRRYGVRKNGIKVTLKPVGLEAKWDFHHDSTSFFQACDGQGSFPGTECRMDGFDEEYWECGKAGFPRCPDLNPPYSYVPHAETVPYFVIGKRYVFANRMFASNFDSSSFISHQYIIAAQASHAVNFPNGPWGCSGGSGDTIQMVTDLRKISGRIETCLNNRTLGDELDAAGLSWRYYTSTINGNGGSWSAYQAIKHIYDGVDWSKDVITPQTQFFHDVTDGALPSVSWITPTCQNSDHAGCGADTGPDWVASLVNAIGESQYWKSTAIFIFWDDYGGWYDHVPPELVDYDGLGFRVPLLVVSAYAKEGYVSQVHYEHGSILKFIEDRWGLPRLSASDTRAKSPEPDCFDFSKPPRAFEPIPTQRGEAYFLNQPVDMRPPDDE
jgi:phospholipase C